MYVYLYYERLNTEEEECMCKFVDDSVLLCATFAVKHPHLTTICSNCRSSNPRSH